jgi:hypothetical protein
MRRAWRGKTFRRNLERRSTQQPLDKQGQDPRPRPRLSCRVGRLAFHRAWHSFEWNAASEPPRPQPCSIEFDSGLLTLPWPVELKLDREAGDVSYTVSTRPARGLPWTLVQNELVRDGVLKLDLACRFVRVEFEPELHSVVVFCPALVPDGPPQPRWPPAYTYRPSCVWSPDSQAPLCGDNALEKRTKERRFRKPRRRVVGLMRRAQRYDLLDQVKNFKEEEECHKTI